MNKKKIIKFIKKQWITLWLIAVSLSLICVVTFAAYKDADNRIKRVFVASKEITSFFTSNYLVSGQNHNAVCFNENDAKSFGVYIRNYDPSSSGVHEGPITYSLTAKLAHINCNDYDTTTDADKLDIWNENSMSISITDGTHSITLSGSTITDSISSIVLPDSDPQTGAQGGKRNTHEWTVTFNNVPLGSDYCVTLIATPDDGTGSIQSTLGISEYPVYKNDGWTCSIADDKNELISSYDAFNYVLTGSGGTSVKFSYDSSKLEINPVFCTYNSEAVLNNSYQGSKSGDHTNWKTVVITVGNNTRYDIQMYKVNSNSPSTWADLAADGSWVEFESVQ